MATHTIKVTPAQVAAAKLRLSIDQRLGLDSSPAVVLIAGARQKSASNGSGPDRPAAQR